MCCCLSTTYYNSSIYLPSSSAKKDKKKQQSGDIYHQKTLLGIFLEFSRSKEKLKECFWWFDACFPNCCAQLKTTTATRFQLIRAFLSFSALLLISVDFLKHFLIDFRCSHDQFFESTTHPNSIKPFQLYSCSLCLVP